MGYRNTSAWIQETAGSRGPSLHTLQVRTYTVQVHMGPIVKKNDFLFLIGPTRTSAVSQTCKRGVLTV